MTITPDTKDWTWVIDRPCPECGFDAHGLPRTEVGDLLRASAAQWQQVLADESVGRRPSPTKWSPLEYACHVRDATEIYSVRLARMLAEDDPLYANWDQDSTALTGQYGEQDPALVSVEVMAAINEIAAAFDAVEGEQWQRTGRRSDGAVFTVDSFAGYFVHDLIHHLHDVR